MTLRRSRISRLATCLLFSEDNSLTKCYNRLSKHFPERSIIIPRAGLHFTLDEIKIPKKGSIRDLINSLSRVSHKPFSIPLSEEIDTSVILPNSSYKNFPVSLRPRSLSNYEIQLLRKKVVDEIGNKGYIKSTKRKPYRGGTYSMPHMKLFSYPVDASTVAMKDFIDEAAKENMPNLVCRSFFLASKISMTDQRHPANNNGKGEAYEIVEEFPFEGEETLRLQLVSN